MKTKFFTYTQNNSGGSFDHKETEGIGYHVIIEATDGTKADERAEDIGLYFNGVDKDIDCECCGDRWASNSSDEGDNTPSIYGEEISDKFESYCGIPSYIHYLDGRIKKI